MFRFPKLFTAAIVGALMLLLAACGGSDAARILEADNTSLRATLDYYKSLDPTLTAQAEQVAQVATLQSDLDRTREEVKSLTVQLNTGQTGSQTGGQPVGQPVVPLATSDPGSFGSVPTLPPTPLPQPANTGDNTSSETSGPVRAASGLVLERVVTAKNKDGDGCAVDPTGSFSTTDAEIWAVADVRNFKSGTVFKTQWTGADNWSQEYEWTIDWTGKQVCVHFFIEPGTLTMVAGTYAVVFSATDTAGETIQSQPVGFTIQ